MDRVRDSARRVTELAQSVRINPDKLEEISRSLVALVSPAKARPWPLQFTDRSRTNFEFVRAAVEFGSGFRSVLKAATGRGAHETVTSGLFGLFITHGDITAATLAGLSLYDVATLFDVPVSVEAAVEGPLGGAVTQFVDAPTRALAVFLHRVLGDCGRILQARGCADFFELVVRELRPTPAEPTVAASRLIELVTGVFPAFDDKALYRGQPVFILKKAQLLVSNLHDAAAAGAITSFRISDDDVAKLTVFADNVLPCVLRHLGVLEIVSDGLRDTIDAGKVLPTGDEEVELRLVAVEACERMCSLVGKRPRDLDVFLWEKGKEPEFRGLNRHYTQNTVYY